jgi:hypothetical protein
MPLMTTILLCVAPGSDTAAPPTDLALNLRLAAVTTNAPLSPQWAMSYYTQPPLIAAPAPIDEPTKSPNDDLPLDIMPIELEPTASDGAEFSLWHDWTMSDLSLEWGLATIGPGVLAPQYGGMSGSPGGGAPGGGGNQRPNGPTFLFPPPTPTPTPPPGPGPGGVDPVPEPASVAVWMAAIIGVVVHVKRRKGSAALA